VTLHRTVILAAVSAAGLWAAARRPQPAAGRYTLQSVDGGPTAVSLGGGLVPGEGARLAAAALALRADGRFDARVVVTWTDSGTVELPSTAAGTWRASGGCVVLTYREVRLPRRCPARMCADTVRVDSGRVTAGGVELRRLIGLGPAAFGRRPVLLFRRAAD
jgi:hypothetical protein